MKTFIFSLPDSFDEKELATCIFSMKLDGNNGTISIDHIDESGQFIRETVPVREKKRNL